MRHTQIVGQDGCILRVVYDWNPDEEMINEIISLDIEDGSIIPLLSDDVLDDIMESVWDLHDDELSGD